MRWLLPLSARGTFDRAGLGARHTVDATAIRHGAGVEQETSDPQDAYARFPRRGPTSYREGWLPG